jgi:capsid protein
MPFSSARMSRLRHASRLYDWRYRILIPQFCDRVWAWFTEVAAVAGVMPDGVGPAVWTPPPLESVDPDKEGIANTRLIRTGQKTWSETIRESGQDPDDVAEELAADFDRFDRLGLTLDCDPRKVSQQGQMQQDGKKQSAAAAATVIDAA